MRLKYFSKKEFTCSCGCGKTIISDELLELYPNISKAKKILKWRPKIDFKKGIKKNN